MHTTNNTLNRFLSAPSPSIPVSNKRNVNLLPIPVTTPARSIKTSTSQAAQITMFKKLKVTLHMIDNSPEHISLILTSYKLPGNNQEQVLDLVVYDIPAKIDNYQLLEHLHQWGNVVLISMRVHKKYKSARIRLYPSQTCLTAYQ